MPITDSFDATTDEIIKATSEVTPLPGFPTTAITCFDPATFNLVTAEFGLTPLPTVTTSTGPLDVWALDDGGQRFAFYRSPMGAPFAAITMEHAIARGVRRFVVFGSCGVLDSSAIATDLIVPTRAYRDEGTSYHYAPASDWMDVATASTTQRVLSELGVPFTAGPVWTTDAFFRETHALADRRRAQGCLAVEMECSALAAVSALRGVPVYQFLETADVLDADAWDPRLLGAMPSEPRLAHARIALEIARRVSA